MSRSLRATDEGIKKIKAAMKQGGFTQKALAEALGISRSVITVLFRGEAIDRANFEELCKFLELDWHDIQGEDVVSDDLELLVKEVKQKIAADVTDRCGTMRVLDMTKPVDLDRIYTDVNIIKNVIGRRRIGYDEVMKFNTRENVNRFSHGDTEKRVKGFEAVEEFQKLVVLGKPGAGKTTFMKYLAMSCLGDRFHGELVPIFVPLKAYAEERGQPSLENYILTEFQKREVAVDVVKRLLKEGRALILLDGLDEVKLEDDRRIKQDIDKFSRDWLKNRFAITCRIAAREYQFEKFTEVEVADFDHGQIETFVNNWFRERDESKAERLLERLKGNEPVKELAKSPLLLSLLCLRFEENNEFPKNRHDLLKEGLDFLLKKWDAVDYVERDVSKHFRGEQIYKNLSPEEKIDMLTGIAFRYFLNDEYFFRQEDLQQKIKDYICKLPEYSNNLEALRLDSEAVLKAIEHHHGLLVERARNIYSFSHLTFQEYFVAREVKKERHFEILMQNTSNPRWKEVFYLTAEMLKIPDDSDNFLKLMKDHIDEMLANDANLQAFLELVNQKINPLKSRYKAVSVRAFSAYTGVRTREFVDLIIDRARTHDLYLSTALELSHDLDYELSQALDLYHSRIFICDLPLLFVTEFAMALDLSLALIFDLSRTLELYHIIDLGLGDNVLRQSLQGLKSQLPSNRKEFHQWWENHGEEWTKELRQVCIDRRNIGHDWQFTYDQKELLNQYYAANLLLVECMNRSYVSKQVREEIESTMLLPSKK